MYDYIIVTHIPAFYKINLYNELAKKLKVFVVFIASDTNEKRADDFVTLEKATFEYQVLFDGNFQDRNVVKNIWKLREIFKNIAFKKLLLSGWDLKEFWYLVMTNSKLKSCLALESTINESRSDGIRGFIKKIFLSRISTVYASGKLHVALLNNLKYKNDIKVTKGVGIINKPNFEFINKEYKKRFLFIGRLSSEKNLMLLINIFNNLPEYMLTLIGTGNQEEELKSIANSNIVFVGQVENSNLQEYFTNNNIFILPSISEPWGLVVEEALNFKLPVIISKNCGVSELIEDGINGYILDFNNIENIRKKLLNINNEIYQKLLYGVDKYSINQKDDTQIESYL